MRLTSRDSCAVWPCRFRKKTNTSLAAHRQIFSSGRTLFFCVRPLIVSGVILLFSFVSTAQEPQQSSVRAIRAIEEPWEPEDIRGENSPPPSLLNPARLFSDGAITLIGFYQSSIGPNSVQRCPFSPSCSNFALSAIRRYGFVAGVCLFIDRNLYRENPGIMNHYGLIRLPSGILKLDDHFYLTGAQ